MSLFRTDFSSQFAPTCLLYRIARANIVFLHLTHIILISDLAMTIIIVFDGDIGEEKGVDSVTNAANQMLNVGLGVAGAIGRACGKPALTKECDEFIRDLQSHTNLSRVPVGSCAITSAFNMAPTQGL